MKHFDEVHCLDTPPLELEINIDTVFKRYNINSFENEEGKTVYEYQED